MATKNTYLNIYTSPNHVYVGDTNDDNLPTANAQDGTFVTYDASYDHPISITVNSSDPAATRPRTIRCAIRCEAGYKTVGDVTITFANNANNYWKISKTANGTFGSSITFEDPNNDNGITNKNVLFYVQATAADNEAPTVDKLTSLTTTATIAYDEYTANS